MKNIFYVYEHWRPDKDVCFWVGKGKKRRAYKFKRNSHYNNIVQKLCRMGMCVEVRLVKSGLTETQSLKLECERIRFWRDAGVELTNKTDGGEGFSGFVRPLGILGTKESRKKLSLARIGMKFSKEHKANLSKKKLGVPRKPFKMSTIRKMRKASRLREQRKRELYGDNVRQNSRIKEPAP